MLFKLRISRKEEAEKRNNFARPPRRQPMKGIATLTKCKSRKWRRSNLDFCRRQFLKKMIFCQIQKTLKTFGVAKSEFVSRFTILSHLPIDKKSSN